MVKKKTKIEPIDEEVRYVMIIADKSVQYYAWLLLLQGRVSTKFVIKATDSKLSKAEELLRLYSNWGFVEEERFRQEEEFIKGTKKYTTHVNIIKCKRVGAVII